MSYAVKELKMSSVNRDVNICYESNVDLIIAYVAWGEIGHMSASDHAKTYAQAMMEAGVDVVLGAHPQVLQPITRKTVTRNDGTTADCIVAYSLGSFITAQHSNVITSYSIHYTKLYEYTCDNPFCSAVLKLFRNLDKRSPGDSKIIHYHARPVAYRSS